MPTIYVDADACPVKDEIYKVALRYGWPVIVVSNAWIAVPKSRLIKSVTVNSGFNEADDWIAERIERLDVVVTEDIELAARCVERQAKAIGTRGQVFRENDIGAAMASRELMAQLREQGMITGGPSPFRDQDRSQFLQRLDQTLQQVRRTLDREQKSASGEDETH